MPENGAQKCPFPSPHRDQRLHQDWVPARHPLRNKQKSLRDSCYKPSRLSFLSNNVVSQPTGEAKPRVRILGISGSSRKGSYNTALLEAAKELAPESVLIETYDISNLPLYNQDLEVKMPSQVQSSRVKSNRLTLSSSPHPNK